MVLKLYGAHESPVARIVAAVLLEKQVPFELVLVDLAKGEHKTPEYLTQHPYGQVPYIVCVSLALIYQYNFDSLNVLFPSFLCDLIRTMTAS